MAAWKDEPQLPKRCYQLWGLRDAGNSMKHNIINIRIDVITHTVFLLYKTKYMCSYAIRTDGQDDGDGIPKHSTDV